MVQHGYVGRIRKAQQHRSLSFCGRLCILDASRDASLYTCWTLCTNVQHLQNPILRGDGSGKSGKSGRFVDRTFSLCRLFCHESRLPRGPLLPVIRKSLSYCHSWAHVHGVRFLKLLNLNLVRSHQTEIKPIWISVLHHKAKKSEIMNDDWPVMTDYGLQMTLEKSIWTGFSDLGVGKNVGKQPSINSIFCMLPTSRVTSHDVVANKKGGQSVWSTAFFSTFLWLKDDREKGSRCGCGTTSLQRLRPGAFMSTKSRALMNWMLTCNDDITLEVTRLHTHTQVSV